MFLEIDFNSDTPIYEQIRRGIIVGLAKGDINPGDRLPSVRDMAENIGINLHTVNKAYKLLVSDGVLIMDRRFGSLIADGDFPMKDFDGKIIHDELELLTSIAKLKGQDYEDFIKDIKEIWEEKNE